MADKGLTNLWNVLKGKAKVSPKSGVTPTQPPPTESKRP